MPRHPLRNIVLVVFAVILLLPTLVSFVPWLVPLLMVLAVGYFAIGARSASGWAARLSDRLQDAATQLGGERPRAHRPALGAPAHRPASHSDSEPSLGSIITAPVPTTPGRTATSERGQVAERPRQRPRPSGEPSARPPVPSPAVGPVDLTNPGFDITSSNSAEPHYGSWG